MASCFVCHLEITDEEYREARILINMRGVQRHRSCRNPHKPSRRVKVLSVEEMQSMMSMVPRRYLAEAPLVDLRWGSTRELRITRDRALLALIYHLGGRINEILALERRHATVDKMGRLRISLKYSKRRDHAARDLHNIPVSSKATFRPHIDKYITLIGDNPDTRLFPITPVSAWMIVTSAWANAYPGSQVKERVSPHSGRHTRATIIAAAGGTLGELMSWLGWKSPTTAQHYIEASGIPLERISEVTTE